MLIFLDWFLAIFHGGLTIFNVIGWVHPATRRTHFWTMSMTLMAWVLIGWHVGNIGYCPLTDWHWDIKRELGETGLPNSFIKYYADKFTGLAFDRDLVDFLTGSVGVGAFIFSTYLNFFKTRV